MTNLSTTYLGLKLKSPIVVSAGPLCKDVANIKKMEEAGAGAVVLHSLFEEQINLESNELDQYLSQGSEVGAEASNMFPDMGNYNMGPDAYLEHIRKAKSAVKIPVIASLNGMTNGGWIRYAKLMEEAGADALELNIYYLPTDPNVTGAQIEEMTCELVANVNSTVRIPLAVKLSPYYSSIANVAKNLDKAGADALVLFNRFYQPDFDLEALEVVPYADVEPLERNQAAPALGSDPVRQDLGGRRDHRRRAHGRRRREEHDGRRESRDDHLCPARIRNRLPENAHC